VPQEIFTSLVAVSPFGAALIWLMVTHWNDIKMMLEVVVTHQVDAKRQRELMMDDLQDIKLRVAILEARTGAVSEPVQMRPNKTP